MKSLISSLLKRHALVTFFALVFLISWIPWYTGGSGFIVYGPSLACLIMVAVVDGKKGLLDLLQRAVRWRVGLVWWVVTLFLPALFCLAGIGVHLLAGGDLPAFTFFRQEWYLAPVFFVLMLVDGPLEEFGWRGFALPKLQEKWSPLIASFIIGALWGIWHLPEFLRPGSPQYPMGIGFLPLFVAVEITNSILMTWLYNKTQGSLLLGGFMAHNALNFWPNVLLTEITMTGILRGEAFPAPDMRLFILEGVVATLVAILLAIVTKGRLGLPSCQVSQIAYNSTQA